MGLDCCTDPPLPDTQLFRKFMKQNSSVWIVAQTLSRTITCSENSMKKNSLVWIVAQTLLSQAQLNSGKFMKQNSLIWMLHRASISQINLLKPIYARHQNTRFTQQRKLLD